MSSKYTSSLTVKDINRDCTALLAKHIDVFTKYRQYPTIQEDHKAQIKIEFMRIHSLDRQLTYLNKKSIIILLKLNACYNIIDSKVFIHEANW